MEFVIQKHGNSGSIEARLECPNGFLRDIPLRILDPDRFAVRFSVDEAGDHYVHVMLNAVEIPNSPFQLLVYDYESRFEEDFSIENEPEESRPESLPMASFVNPLGMGLKRINLFGENEFKIDATNAGDEKLLVGIYGPHGYIDELFVHHLGNHYYYIRYYAGEPGPYIISILWGGINVPGSPYFIDAPIK